MAKRRLLVTVPFDNHLLDKIVEAAPQLQVEHEIVSESEWPEDKTTDAEIIYTTDKLPSPEQAPNLRWVQTHWAGIDRLPGTPLWESDIQLTTASGIHTPNMGQYVMAQILSWASRVPDWIRTQQKGEWPPRRRDLFMPDELRDRTIGIIGYGSIGREVARLAHAFGMTILVIKNDAKQIVDRGYLLEGQGDPEGDLPTRIYPPEAIRSMVALCDYVVVTLPLTEKSHHLLDESVFREMKPTSFLVNVSRGSVINEADLIKALQRGRLAGAGLDVFETEPLPASSPLWAMNNVIITPHISGFTPHYDERAVDLFVTNLNRYLAGETLLNVVNRATGY